MRFKEIPQKCHDEWGSFPEHLSEVPVSVCPGGAVGLLQTGQRSQRSFLPEPHTPTLPRSPVPRIPSSQQGLIEGRRTIRAEVWSLLRGAVGVSLLTLSLEGSPPNVGGCIISESLRQKTL